MEAEMKAVSKATREKLPPSRVKWSFRGLFLSLVD